MDTNIHTHTHTHTQRNSLSVDDNIYAPPWGLSTLAMESSVAARIMQSYSKKLSTLVADRILKCKQTGPTAAVAT